MTVFWIITGVLLICAGILAHLYYNAAEDAATTDHVADYTFIIEEGEGGTVDVCLYAGGHYHSLTFVWKKRDGAWKYGGDRPWAGHTATREMAIEISKKWLIRDAESLKMEGKQ